MTDVRLYQSSDGGEIDFDENGNPVLAVGLETAAYLSLFGGNLLDSGIEADDPFQWWGNYDETQQDRRYRSETQALVQGLPNVPGNLLRIQDAMSRDLQWFVSSSLATDLQVGASVPGHNRLDLTVDLTIDGETFEFTFPVITQ